MSSKSQRFTHQNPDLWEANATWSQWKIYSKFTPAVLMFCQRIDFNIDRTPIQFFSVFTGLPIATHSLPPPLPLHTPLEVTNQL